MLPAAEAMEPVWVSICVLGCRVESLAGRLDLQNWISREDPMQQTKLTEQGR